MADVRYALCSTRRNSSGSFANKNEQAGLPPIAPFDKLDVNKLKRPFPPNVPSTISYLFAGPSGDASVNCNILQRWFTGQEC